MEKGEFFYWMAGKLLGLILGTIISLIIIL